MFLYVSGLRKAKKYDWKDSNMALFGSDTDRKVKKESAMEEPAWQGAGQAPGIKIWRIVKFKVTDWPKEDYGRFYNGDSYIILNTYVEEGGDELLHDVHFWIGKNSTQDEYGTAAYKTVELDTFLDDKPVQHRETEGHESDMFKSYFETITTMKGGADTGFRRVQPEEYKARLLKFCGTGKNIKVTEVPTAWSSLNSDDVFIFDLGRELYQVNGQNATKDERFKALQYLQKLKADNKGKSEVLDLEEDENNKGSFKKCQELSALKDDRDDDDDEDDDEVDESGSERSLFRISDESGHLEFTQIASGKLEKSMLNSKDVFLVDNVTHLFIWTGKEASIDERRNAFAYAHKHLQGSKHPFIPVTCLTETSKPVKEFEDAFN
ncbi:gelsolin-like protein 2 [Ylistrum balloti]|uniref:gelsolin-like protein 2 n=1 Tax=Ylistrum balloti TaxID=509963 RepID=UPI0029057E82|nr:gelsolin-like protein 2 [Ylistrum balloti]